MTHWRGPLSCRMSHILGVSCSLLMVLSDLFFLLMACISILQFHFVLLGKLPSDLWKSGHWRRPSFCQGLCEALPPHYISYLHCPLKDCGLPSFFKDGNTKPSLCCASLRSCPGPEPGFGSKPVVFEAVLCPALLSGLGNLALQDRALATLFAG